VRELLPRHQILSHWVPWISLRVDPKISPSQIPYEQNVTAADQLKQLIEAVSGGYIAVTGCAGVGKSMLVQEGNRLIVWNCERQLDGPYYRWMAMNSNVARKLGWTLCPTNPFEWRDSAAHSMVKSMYWKDGWIWLEPPSFEALGEGWYVLASDLAVEAIRRAFPDAQTHLWVERHSHGVKLYRGSWHLRQPF